MKVLHNMEIKIRATYGQHSLGVKFSYRIGFQIIGVLQKYIYLNANINLSCQGVVHFSAS